MREKNKAVARRFLEELWNRSNFVVVDELLASDYDGHSSTVIRGPEGAMAFIPRLRAAFPDFQFRVLDQIAEGDKVATRWELFGTHESAFQGMPPSGKRVEMTGITIFRIANGKLIEGWTNEDALGMLLRLVRHPIGSSVLALWLGAGLGTINWLLLVLWPVFVALSLMLMARTEEALLREKFGAEYEEYSQQTRRFIPGL